MNTSFFSPEGNLLGHSFVNESWIIERFSSDKLWVWGKNSYGQLGTNDTVDKLTPVTTFAGGTDWKRVSAGSLFAGAIKSDGTLWVWGENSNGQLGTNDVVNRWTPVTTFAGGNNWKSYSISNDNSAAIKTDGTLWTWGKNNYGELGTNDITNTYELTPVTTFAGGRDWKQVSCGKNIISAIKTNGTLWVWGANNYGQLGTNDTVDKLIPVTTFAGGTNWKQVSCGDFSIGAIKTDGTLWVWGENSDAQLGTNDNINRWTPVTTFAGGNNWKRVHKNIPNTTSASKTNGTLWMWGENSYGELGTNDNIIRSTPVTTFAGGNDWKTAYTDSGAIKTDGTLWMWRENGFGQLGTNDIISRSTPVTTFAGGNNWKQIACGDSDSTYALTTGPEFDVFGTTLVVEPFSQTYTSTVNITVPTGVLYLNYVIHAGKGGRGGLHSARNTTAGALGARGQKISGILYGIGGQTLTLTMGSQGYNGVYSTGGGYGTGYVRGGTGGSNGSQNINTWTAAAGGGGGGATAISNIYTLYALAGGGGGGAPIGFSAFGNTTPQGKTSTVIGYSSTPTNGNNGATSGSSINSGGGGGGGGAPGGAGGNASGSGNDNSGEGGYGGDGYYNNNYHSITPVVETPDSDTPYIEISW